MRGRLRLWLWLENVSWMVSQLLLCETLKWKAWLLWLYLFFCGNSLALPFDEARRDPKTLVPQLSYKCDVYGVVSSGLARVAAQQPLGISPGKNGSRFWHFRPDSNNQRTFSLSHADALAGAKFCAPVRWWLIQAYCRSRSGRSPNKKSRRLGRSASASFGKSCAQLGQPTRGLYMEKNLHAWIHSSVHVPFSFS